MAVTLGRLGSLSAPFGDNIINITVTEECEAVDVSNRSNTSGGFKVSQAGFRVLTYEIECHDPSGAIADLTNSPTGYVATVTNVTENINIDGAVTYTITAKGGD
jgi:hypothetical protein